MAARYVPVQRAATGGEAGLLAGSWLFGGIPLRMRASMFASGELTRNFESAS